MTNRLPRPVLDDRSRDILDAVVRLNIETGRAVSSGLVERSVRRRVSSATIRTVMKRLEEDGFLVQLHTSSGRVPTDAGFRSFVDGLRAGWTLRRHDPPRGMRDLISVTLDDGSGSRLKDVASLLGRLTDNIGIIVGPNWSGVRVARVEVYPRDLRRALVVVILDNSRVHTGLVRFDEDRPEAVVTAAARLLAARAEGLTVAEVRGGALASPDLLGSPASRCASELAREGQRVVAELAEGEVELDGVANVLDEPEFRDPEPLCALLRFLESPRAIRESLDRLAGRHEEGFGVWIGSENPLGGLQRFSVLTRRFAVDGRRGMLAVVGPRRMSYQRALHGMDLLGSAIDDDPGRLAC